MASGDGGGAAGESVRRVLNTPADHHYGLSKFHTLHEVQGLKELLGVEPCHQP